MTKEDVFESRESLSSLASSRSPSAEHIISPIELDTAPVAPPRRVDFSKPRGTRATALSQAAATKKLLQTSPQETSGATASGGKGVVDTANFRRGTYMSRSVRVENKKGDSLAYIADKSVSKSTSVRPPPAAAAKPASSQPVPAAAKPGRIDIGLKGKVEIKQQKPTNFTRSALPKLLPRLPIRPPVITSTPKAPSHQARSGDDEEDAEERDSLAPLPSDVIRSWAESAAQASYSAAYENPIVEQDDGAANGGQRKQLVGSVVENVPDDNRASR